MAKTYVVGNWKNYVTSLKEGKKLFKDIEKKLPRELKSHVIVCPPALLLHPISSAYSGNRVSFGAQDIFFESGAHTGENPVSLAKDVGAVYSIAGHAERRAQGETDEVVAKEVGAALDAKVTPIVTFGEAARDKDGHYLQALEETVLASLALVTEKTLRKTVLAYEPVWAIGAPLPPDPRTIRETIIFIRKTLATKYPKADALKVPILYGGAVNVDSADELIEQSGANGFLLGRASVDAETFTDIVKKFQ